MHTHLNMQLNLVFEYVLLQTDANVLYCVCKAGIQHSDLQKTVTFACRHGADCSLILKSGPCYNPNTVKNHCDYAVNSYFQRKNQAAGSCDFYGVTTVQIATPGIYHHSSFILLICNNWFHIWKFVTNLISKCDRWADF